MFYNIFLTETQTGRTQGGGIQKDKTMNMRPHAGKKRYKRTKGTEETNFRFCTFAE